jgi:protein-S-isoprenylcysteine O-methyltransferase Ste14
VQTQLIFTTYSIFLSNFDAQLFYSLTAIWIVSELIMAWLIPMIRHRKERIPHYNCGSTFILLLATNFGIYLGLGLSNLTNVFWPESYFYFGIALMVTGLLIRTVAIMTLGRFFSPFLRIVSGHSLVRKGLYRYIRHPSYTGAILSFIGIGFCFRSPVGIIIVAIVTLAIYWWRSSLEERMLIGKFGNEYRNYMKKSWMMIPFLL